MPTATTTSASRIRSTTGANESVAPTHKRCDEGIAPLPLMVTPTAAPIRSAMRSAAGPASTAPPPRIITGARAEASSSAAAAIAEGAGDGAVGVVAIRSRRGEGIANTSTGTAM